MQSLGSKDCWLDLTGMRLGTTRHPAIAHRLSLSDRLVYPGSMKSQRDKRDKRQKEEATNCKITLNLIKGASKLPFASDDERGRTEKGALLKSLTSAISAAALPCCRGGHGPCWAGSALRLSRHFLWTSAAQAAGNKGRGGERPGGSLPPSRPGGGRQENDQRNRTSCCC